MRVSCRIGVGVLGIALAFANGCSEEPKGRSEAASSTPTRPSASARAPGSAGDSDAASPGTNAAVPARSREARIAAGRSVYNANCIACHSMDPTQDGALGPAVAGASRELIEARVVHGTYPEGYTPKRDTRVMVALPHLEPRIDELAAYLGSLEQG